MINKSLLIIKYQNYDQQIETLKFTTFNSNLIKILNLQYIESCFEHTRIQNNFYISVRLVLIN